MRMYTGTLSFDLLLGDVRSLKQKRSVVRPIVAELQRKFSVSAAEVGGQDLYRRARIGLAAVSLVLLAVVATGLIVSGPVAEAVGTATGQTALMMAVAYGQNGIAELLLAAGADPEARDNAGNSARSLAQMRGNAVMAARLSGKGTPS